MQQSVVTMVVFLGMAVGSMTFGTIADFFGRKPAVVIDIALSSVAGLLSAAAPNVIWFGIFRFLVGMGLGGFILTAAFLAEFMPIEKRGITLCGYQMFWSVGACTEALLAWAVMPRFYWRGLIIASSAPLGKKHCYEARDSGRKLSVRSDIVLCCFFPSGVAKILACQWKGRKSKRRFGTRCQT